MKKTNKLHPQTVKNLQTLKSEGIESYLFGKIQPQALDLEAAVLGALMLDKDAISVVSDILTEDSFYKDAHQYIYAAIKELWDRSQPIDLLTVQEQLKKDGRTDDAGGAYYLVELTGRVGSSANIEYHARIVQQKHIRRQLIKLGNEVIRENFDETNDIFTALEECERNLFNITQGSITRHASGMPSNVADMLAAMDAAKDKKGLIGIPTGFSGIDKITGGLQQPDLIIIAARPGMGKTSIVLSIAKNVVEDNKAAAFFSLEMSTLQLTQRLTSIDTGINVKYIKSAKLSEVEWQSVHAAAEKLGDAPLYIDDTPSLSISELRSKCRRLKMQHDIGLVVVDYIQLMKGDQRSGLREQEVSSISRALKAIAKEIEVPVIALSQLSRAVETRGGSKRPQLSDLRESGSLEQDADIVAFLYRPEYYKILEDENGLSLKGVCEFIIAKHRNGETETVKLNWEEKYTRFSDMADQNFLGIEDTDPFKGK